MEASATQRPSVHPSRSGFAIREAPKRINNLWWEYRLGISTRGLVPVDHFDSCPYGTMSYSNVWKILDHLELGSSDVFVDIGSGKGRILCCAARNYPVERVVGVDLSEPFCEAARENALRLRGRHAPIHVHTGTADEFDYSDASVLFLFNPFGATTLAPLLEKVGREPHRELRVVYANPSSEHDAVFEQQTWLEPTDRWDVDETDMDQTVSFYRSR